MRYVKWKQFGAIVMAMLLTLQMSSVWQVSSVYAVSESDSYLLEETDEDALEAVGVGVSESKLETAESGDTEVSDEIETEPSVGDVQENDVPEDGGSVSGNDAVTDDNGESGGVTDEPGQDDNTDDADFVASDMDKIDITSTDMSVIPNEDTDIVTEEEILDGEETILSDVPAGMEDLVAAIGPDGIEVQDGHIRLLENRSMTGSVAVSNSLVLDLNGFTLSYTAASAAENMLYVTGNLALEGAGTLLMTGGDNVISVTASGSVRNEDCRITGSGCTRGVFTNGLFEMHGGSISGINTQANGGGIVVHGASGRLDMSGGEISGNTAWFGGGVRVQTGAVADIYGTAVIAGNEGLSAGGGIHVLNSTCNIYGQASVSNNVSATGGGIYVSGTGVANIKGQASVLYNVPDPYATVDSGAVNVTEDADIGGMAKTLQDWIDETPDGGVLDLNRDFLNQAPVTITKTITIMFHGYTIEGAGSNSGQLLYCQGGDVTLCGPGTLSQKAGPSTIYSIVNVQAGCHMTVDGLSVTGSGVRGFLVENSYLCFVSGDVTGCGNAVSSGGAINVINGEVVIEGGQFSGNLSVNGGVIRALSDSQVTIRSGSFYNNQANYGGAVYMTGSSLLIEGGSFSDNRAMNGQGGAIWSDSDVVISGSTSFTGNQSRTGDYTRGGAVYCTGNISVSGSPVFDNNTAGMGGAIYSTDVGSLVINGGEFLNNSAVQLGGAIIGCNITIDGPVNIHDNSASWGGGIAAGCIRSNAASVSYMNDTAKLVISSNARIANNRSGHYGTAYRGQGAGIWAYDCELTGGADISGNVTTGSGGGIYSRHSLKITDADITGNTADIGGGIFLYNEGFIQGTSDNRIHITGNTALDEGYHGFAGGGIFVEHLVDKNTQGPYGANLQINGVIITDNTANGGGGLGGCGEAMVHTYGGVGMAMYDNHSTGSGTSARATDLYLDGYGTLSSHGIGHTNIVFEGLGKTDSSDWAEYVIDNGSETLHGMRFSASMTDADKTLADQIAGVIIAQNTCKSNGGGIGGNGAITLGMPVQEITASKVWDDDNDAHGARPEVLNLTLKHKGRRLLDGALVAVDEVIDTQPVTKEDGWRYTWYDLDELDDANQPWLYYVDEIEVPDYMKDISGTVITNHYAYTEFVVQKIWDDEDDKDGIRPESVTITVLRDGEVWDEAILSKENDWKKSYEHVDKYAEDKHEYAYTVREDVSYPGYISQVSGFVVTNKHVPAGVFDFTIEKHWVDENDTDGLRPESIVVQVFRNGTLFDEAVLNADCDWKKEYKDIPKTDPFGNTYVYTISEPEVPDGYLSEVDGFIITNTHKVIPKMDIRISKFWDDEEDKDGLRPDKVTVVLYQNGNPYDEYELSAAEGWELVVSNLDETDAAGVPYVWTVKEKQVPDGYVSVSDGYEITNKHIPDEEPEVPRTTFRVHKIWDDSMDAANKRPDSIHVTVLRNGELYDVCVLDEHNGWSHTYQDVEAQSPEGDPYVYAVAESEVPEGYVSLINGYVITNHYEPEPEPEVTSFVVKKIWSDSEDADGIRPASVVINVLQNGYVMDTAFLSDGNGWQKQYDNLPVYDAAGQPFVYTVQEKDIPDGYESAVNGFEITNTHVPDDEPEKKFITFTVVKQWDDENNADGIRPEFVTVDVLRNGMLYDQAVLSANNAWSKTYAELEAEDGNGNPYEYTIKEDVSVLGYESWVSGFTIVNRHVPEKKPETMDFMVKKIWDDGNRENLRPQSVLLQVLRDGALWDEVELGSWNNWQHQYTDVEKYRPDGSAYVWQVREPVVPDGYEAETAGFTVINHYKEPEETPDTTGFVIRKIWDDADNVDNIRPNSVVIEVLRQGSTWQSVILDNSNGWSYAMYGLDPAYEYTIREVSVPDGYEAVVSGFTIINRHVPDKPEEPAPTDPPVADIPREQEKVVVSPQTGVYDTNAGRLWAVVSGVLSCMIGAIVVLWKKYRGKND